MKDETHGDSASPGLQQQRAAEKKAKEEQPAEEVVPKAKGMPKASVTPKGEKRTRQTSDSQSSKPEGTQSQKQKTEGDLLDPDEELEQQRAIDEHIWAAKAKAEHEAKVKAELVEKQRDITPEVEKGFLDRLRSDDPFARD